VTLAFPDSFGLWPLRLVSAWPGEIGRGLGGLLFVGQLGSLALSRAGDFAVAGSPGARTAAAALGLVVQLAAGLVFFRLAEQPSRARLVLLVLAACAAVAAIVPPLSAANAAELGAAVVLAVLGSWRDEIAPRTGLQFLAGVMVTAPLAELRPALLSLGRASGSIAALDSGTGVPALVWALLATAATGAGLAVWLRDKPAKVRPT